MPLVFDLSYWPEADDALTRLEKDPDLWAVLKAVDRVLVGLSADPFNPRLGTTQFMTDQYGGVCATPARLEEWYVFWQRGQGSSEIEIILIHQLGVGVVA